MSDEYNASAAERAEAKRWIEYARRVLDNTSDATVYRHWTEIIRSCRRVLNSGDGA